MLKSVLLVSLCLVLVYAEPKQSLQNDTPQTSSLARCDIQSIVGLGGEIVSATVRTLVGIVVDIVTAVVDLVFCLFPFDLYMCLLSDMEYGIIDSIENIGTSLVDYVQTLGDLLTEISEDIASCASV